ncbi:MAG: HAD family hydrolase [Armatimonadota bacterium]
MNKTTKNTLLIDADDTLWENGIYYENAVLNFISLMKSKNIFKDTIEEIIRKRKIENLPRYGYGSHNLYNTMVEVYKEGCELNNTSIDDEIMDFLKSMRHKTRNYSIEFLPGVKETLPMLFKKNSLILVTKGNYDEQKDKIERSGVLSYFHSSKIVPEKDIKTYKDIIEEFKLNTENTWMIGNSPRSDINPAKAAGLGTVFIPYHMTWEHETERIQRGARETIILKDFSELKIYFN